MSREMKIYTHFMGEDATLRVEYEITSYGARPIFDDVYGGDPGYGPEWDIYDIGLTLHLEDGDGAEWLLDGKQFRLIANSGDVVNAILEEIAEDEDCRPYRRGRRSYWDDAA